PPGAGKGTQGERIADRLGVPKVATGDVLRAAVRDGTEMGLAAKSFMDRGALVPDSVILGIVKEALATPEMANGVVLDGVVRTVPQAEGLQKVFSDLGRTLDCVLMFDIADDEVVRRLAARTVCERCQTPYTGMESGQPCPKPGCGGVVVRRMDDEPEAIRMRMRAYRGQTEPVVAWYRNDGTAFVQVDAVGGVDAITQRVMASLDDCRKRSG
ncbi:MAG TPA: adenylate kinase, partial [Gemmatimonadaceae bacterium]|nr:adenylate kinase [Gemmatimonadaceae bacterium]